jgi:hypothetical protein
MATITYTVTVANSGSGNVYYIDGAANPALTFARGNTYVFDLADNSNNNHPLAFKDSFGNSYTDDVTTTGTAGNAGANVTIVVDNETPTPLRYYCTVHGEGMGNTIDVTGVGTITYTTTVASPSGYNIYVVEGSNNPALTFVRGNTYVFDLSDGSNGGHPLAFKNAAGNSYTTGVTTTGTAGSSGAKVSILVGATTPTELRYYCTVHGNAMGNTVDVPVVGAYSALYGSGQYGTANFGVAFVTKIISSVSATGSVGSLSGTTEEPLLSVSATGSIGTVKPNISEPISGVSGTTVLGILKITDVLQPASGVSATGLIGTVFAQAFLGANDALYGRGLYGSAVYGSVTPVVNLPTQTLVGTIETVRVGGQFEVDVQERLGSVSGTGQVASVITNPLLLGSVSATGGVGTLQTNIQENEISSVSATGSIGTLTHSNTHSITSVVGTFTLNKGNRPFAKAFTFVTSSSVVTTSAIGTLKLNVDEPISGVLGTTALGTPEVITTEALLSVSATGSIGVLTHSNTHSLASVQGTTAVEQVQINGFEIDVQERLGSVSATGAINGALTHSNTHNISSAVGTFNVGNLTTTGVTFNFIASDYDRKRVVYVPRQDTAAERRVAA